MIYAGDKTCGNIGTTLQTDIALSVHTNNQHVHIVIAPDFSIRMQHLLLVE
jgi:hypothetical protein